MSVFDLSLSEQLEHFRAIQKKAAELFNLYGGGCGGPLEEVFYCLLKNLEALDAQAPYRVGDRVVLARTPDLTNSPGWHGREHFLVEGAKATVEQIDFGKKGYTVSLHFDDESYISGWGEDKGKVIPIEAKDRSRYGFRAASVRPIGEEAESPAETIVALRKEILKQTIRIASLEDSILLVRQALP